MHMENHFSATRGLETNDPARTTPINPGGRAAAIDTATGPEHDSPTSTYGSSRGKFRSTMRLSQALALIEVKVLEHFVVGKSITSMRDRGLLT
jgi:hypothetical protein